MSKTIWFRGKQRPIRVALDWGNVIASDRLENGKIAEIEQYHLRPEVAGAIEGVAQLVAVLGAENVFIIRNGFGPRGEKNRREYVIEQTKRWFALNKFFERTKMRAENVFYPEDREGKQKKCEELYITHLVEDRVEVAQHLVHTRWIAFRPKPRETVRFIQNLPRFLERRSYLVWDWSMVPKAILEPREFLRQEPTYGRVSEHRSLVLYPPQRGVHLLLESLFGKRQVRGRTRRPQH